MNADKVTRDFSRPYHRQSTWRPQSGVRAAGPQLLIRSSDQFIAAKGSDPT